MMMDVILTTYQGAILGPIAKLLGYILQVIYAVLAPLGINNTGICIILFTFIVNGIMLPMQFKQQKFGKLSAIMNPEITAIQNKYKNKKDQASQQKMSLETQAVYHKYGVSPASGCLPMLITFPILFALYRVIYNIPAYVPQVKALYVDLANSLQNAGITLESISTKDYINSTTYVVQQATAAAAEAKNVAAVNINYYIDVLSNFSSDGWNKLSMLKGIDKQMVLETANNVKGINYFLGLNLADRPVIKSISVVIPVLSVITQFISTKLSMAGTQQGASSENPTAQSMKTMNNVMPFISGGMCLMFPIGVGIYWIAGNVFRIIQSIFINIYFKNVDMDEEIKKNVEKAKAKYEKRGMDYSALDKAAKTKTSNINLQDKNSTNAAEKKKTSISSAAGKKSTAPVNKNQSKKYKEGSIAAYANLLNRDDNEK